MKQDTPQQLQMVDSFNATKERHQEDQNRRLKYADLSRQIRVEFKVGDLVQYTKEITRNNNKTFQQATR